MSISYPDLYLSVFIIVLPPVEALYKPITYN
jgi:hypothetical protein